MSKDHSKRLFNDEKNSWETAIAIEWNARHQDKKKETSIIFPLAANPFGEEEILAMINVLLSGRLTLGDEVAKAEKKFADMLGVRYAVMVNSGSSANLLAVSAISNKLRKVHCKPGDEVFVPAVCWSTSVFPLLQHGLRPIFLDVSPSTFNITIEELERKLTSRVKAIMVVHVLGNSVDMFRLMAFAQHHQLIIIEDTCESLGTYCTRNNDVERRMLGTFGDFGMFSFYFSHHITSGEGGMIVCKTEEDFNLLRCLRAHGWTRHLTNRETVENNYPDFDPRFLFVNVGYNVRPLEVQGAMINVQLEKLTQFNTCRRDNMRRIRNALLTNSNIQRILSLMEPSSNIDPAWFGVGALLHRPYAHQRLEFLDHLEKNGVENRPIISGNFIRQPCLRLYCQNERPEDYPGAEAIHMRGFFIGIHQIHIDQVIIDKLVNIILEFQFRPKHIILVIENYFSIRPFIEEFVDESILKQETSSTNTTSNSIIPEWVFIDSDRLIVNQQEDIEQIFKRLQPTYVIQFLSPIVLKTDVTKLNVDRWLHEMTLNSRLLQLAIEFQQWCGPIRVLSILCNNLLNKIGSSVTHLNQWHTESGDDRTMFYSDSFDVLLRLTQQYRDQYQSRFISLLCGNVFGPYGDFSLTTSSIVHSILRNRIDRTNSSFSLPILMSTCNDTTYSLVFIRDLVRMIRWSMIHYDDDAPLMVKGSILSVNELVEHINHAFKNVSNKLSDKKDNQNQSSVFESTSFISAIQETIEWYTKEISSMNSVVV